MTALDGTGIHALETFAERVHESGRALKRAREIRGEGTKVEEELVVGVS